MNYYSLISSMSKTPAVDADALAFITAASITDTTQKNAINTFVTDLKGYGIWTKMKAIYPFVGGTAFSHKFNLKDPRDLDEAYRLFFGGGGTHGANGYLTNGTTAWANTWLPPNTQLTKNSTHISMYCGNNPTPIQANPAFGATQSNGNSYYMHLKHPGDSQYHGYVGSTGNEVNFPNVNTKGFHVLTRTGSAMMKAYKNGSLLSTNTATDTTNLPGQTINLGRLSTDGGWVSTTENNYEHRLVSIGDGLTDTESANLYIAVQKYQTTLGRSAELPIVSDSDAQAFIDSADITNTTEANAINTLVTDLKSANIWTKMKAVYPFVGGTAFSCKFNLKDPRDLDVAYRLAPSGGLSYSNLGVLTNGTNSYYFTNIYPNVDLTLNNAHMSIYSNLEFTDTMTDVGLVMGSTDVSYNNRFLGAISNSNTDSGFNNNDIPSGVGVTESTKLGYYIGTRTSSTSHKFFKNGALVATSTTANSKTMPTFQMYLGAWNVGGTARVANRRMATVTIGSGLSDSESVALHNAVHAFNTTLGRNY